MNLREIRPWAQTWFALELIAAFAVMLAALLFGPFLWGWSGLLGLAGVAMSVLAGVAVFVFLAWVGRDARRSQARVHADHRRERPGPDGDMTNVAGAPDLPPWLGGTR